MRSFTLRGPTLYLPDAALKGNLERALSVDATRTTRQTRCCCTCGGQTGSCALAAGVLGEDAVLGVEAGPETVKLTQRNLAATGLDGEKVLKGASDGAVEFGQRPAFWASALKGPEGWPENAGVIQVQARPVAKLLAKFAPTVISSDIEGGDLHVLTQPLPGVRLVVVETYPQVYGPEGIARIERPCRRSGSSQPRARGRIRWSFGGAERPDQRLVVRRRLRVGVPNANGGPEGPPWCPCITRT